MTHIDSAIGIVYFWVCEDCGAEGRESTDRDEALFWSKVHEQDCEDLR